MTRIRAAILCVAVLALPVGAGAEYGYHQPTERLVTLGTQALMICNGLFVSNRTLDQIYEGELKLRMMPLLPPDRVTIDEERRAIRVGGDGNLPFPAMRAAYREGFGCIVMGPDQTFEDIDELPILERPAPAGDAAKIPWPDGDLVTEKRLPATIDGDALEAAWDWALNRVEHGGHRSQLTLSLLVVHGGDIVFERYAPGVDMTTKTRTWSTAKSIASTLIGIAVDGGKLALDESLPFDDWGNGSDAPVSPGDPRRDITLRHVLNMSSGLYPVDNERCRVVGSCLSYFGGMSSVAGALDRGLVHGPGTHWDYENYDTLLGVYALRTALGDDDVYHRFPREALLDRIGMRNTIPGVDRFGDFVLSSQVYTNARDLARFGLLYLNGGKWNGEQIVSERWVGFVRTPAPATLGDGAFYGGQFWLPPDDRTDVPQDAYATSGNRGQYTIIIPSLDLVIVRRGLDWLPGKHRFSRWDLTREVLKAFEKRPWGVKHGKTTDDAN